MQSTAGELECFSKFLSHVHAHVHATHSLPPPFLSCLHTTFSLTPSLPLSGHLYLPLSLPPSLCPSVPPSLLLVLPPSLLPSSSRADAPIIGYLLEFCCNVEHTCGYRPDGHNKGEIRFKLKKPERLQWDIPTEVRGRGSEGGR